MAETILIPDTSGTDRKDRADLLAALKRLGDAVRDADDTPVRSAREKILDAARAFIDLAYDETVEDLVHFVDTVTEGAPTPTPPAPAAD